MIYTVDKETYSSVVEKLLLLLLVLLLWIRSMRFTCLDQCQGDCQIRFFSRLAPPTNPMFVRVCLSLSLYIYICIYIKNDMPFAVNGDLLYYVVILLRFVLCYLCSRRGHLFWFVCVCVFFFRFFISCVNYC